MTILNADKWLYMKITGDATLAVALGSRVYADAAPLSTLYPLVVISQVVSNQVANVSADQVMDNELWQVVVWGSGASYTGLEGIADRLRAVLHKASGTGVIGAVYESSRRLSEVEGDAVFKGILMEFRLFTQ